MNAFYNAMDAIFNVAADTDWKACGRSSRIYSLPTYKVLGRCERSMGEWKWNDEAVGAAGFNSAVFGRPCRGGADGDVLRDAPRWRSLGTR